MGFKARNFETTEYTEEELNPKRRIIISCEGSNTEPAYFKTIKEKLSKYISVLLEIEVIEKEPGASEPKDVVSNLENFLDSRDKEEYGDELWLVWDIEIVESRRKNILAVLPECQEKNYNIAMANPLFKFWLLLHLVDISTYNKGDLSRNDKIPKKQRFIENELSINLGKYTKKSFNKNIVTKENIDKALKQEKLFENEVEKIIDKLGSNIGDLIHNIFKT